MAIEKFVMPTERLAGRDSSSANDCVPTTEDGVGLLRMTLSEDLSF